MIPILNRKRSRSKNREWHGFISEEDENIYKSYELKNMFYHFTKKYSTVAILFFEGYIEVTSWLVSADDFSSRVARGANERVSAANE